MAEVPATPPVAGVPETPQPSAPPDRAEEERLLRSLFELRMEISRTHDEATRDSLQAEYEAMVAQINELDLGRARTDELREERLQRTEALLQELGREFQGSEVDWAEVSKAFDSGMKSFGVGLEQLGEFLQDLEVNVGDDQFQLDDGRGTRINVPLKLPPDVQKSLAEGLSEFIGALEDSSSHDAMSEILKFIPPDANRRFAFVRPPREVKRHVVAQSVFRFTEGFDLAENEIVQGDVIIVGANANIAGEVLGNTYVLLGDLLVEEGGMVGKDAVSIGGEVTLEEDSSVGGRMFDISHIAPGFLAGPWGGVSSGMAIPMHGIRVAVLALLLIIGFALVGDRFTQVARHTAAAPLRNLLWGSIYLLAAVGGFVVISLGLAITVIGIPVAIVLAVAFGGIMLAAYFIACEVLGTRLLTMVGGEKPRALWVAGLLGLAILEIPSFLAASMPHSATADTSLPLQVLDYVLKFVALSIGLGSIVATRFGSRPRETVRVLPLTVEEASHNPT